MNKILIVTKALDEHAITVECALAKKGHKAHRWHCADFPALQTISCSIGQADDFHGQIRGPGIELDGLDFGTIWYRRPARVALPTSWLHPDDVPAAARENEMFWQSFPHLLSHSAVWVNHWEARVRANSKVVQLCTAKDVGIAIPETLIGNDPAAIKAFVEKNKNGVIYKTFYPMRWIDGQTVAKARTAPLSLASLPSEKMLKVVPGIYQKRIRKRSELRVTFMGHAYFAVEIFSQDDPRGIEDFRSIPAKDMNAKPFILPDDLASKCRTMMARLGILFCSFDFVVDVDGNYIFLEVNEQGQFLWLEQLCPELPLLDAFTDFLLDPKMEFQYDKIKPEVEMADIFMKPNYNDLYDADNASHVYVPDPVLAEPEKVFGVNID